MTAYNIELVQNDTDNVGAVLKEDGVGANLSGATVKFVMKNDLGNMKYEINCNDNAVINGVTILKSAGGVTIPFTSTHTDVPGLFFGKILVTLLDNQVSFPSSDYLTVKIEKAL